MTTTSTNNQGRRVIIEGPDCVGKDTFIAGLQDYINGVDRFDGTNMEPRRVEVVTLYNTNPPKVLRGDKEIQAYLNEHDGRIEYHGSSDFVVEMKPRFAETISHRSIHSKDGSPESAEFIRKLDAGEITDQRAIAEEYLQVHYDLERLASKLEEVMTLVIMNRSLISYHAMQIQCFGYLDLFDKWKKLWDYSDQDSALFVRLTAPEAVVKERLAKRQSIDFRGEVESFYMDRWRQIEEGFEIFQNSGMCKNTITVDTTESPIAAYEQIIEWVVKNQIGDSLDRQEGMFDLSQFKFRTT